MVTSECSAYTQSALCLLEPSHITNFLRAQCYGIFPNRLKIVINIIFSLIEINISQMSSWSGQLTIVDNKCFSELDSYNNNGL